MKCELCKTVINPKDSHNGNPLVMGRVCSNCHWKVIRKRLQQSKMKEAAFEENSVTGERLIKALTDLQNILNELFQK